MNAKHTPGPWSFDDNYMWIERTDSGSRYHHRVIAANGDTWTPIALCKSNAKSVDNAENARLIAASPDLLSVLMDMVEFLEPMRFDRPRDDKRAEELDIRARAVIEKATGQPQ